MQAPDSMSRRKQLKPARLGPPPLTGAAPSEQSTPSMDTDALGHKTAIKEGNEYGPFAATKTDGDGDDERTIEIVDTGGGKHNFVLGDELSYQWLKQLNFTGRPDQANCSLLFDGESLKLRVTAESESIDSLLACFVSTDGPKCSTEKLNGHTQQEQTKKFVCERCRIASFNSISNLEAHRTYYCKPIDAGVIKCEVDSTPVLKSSSAEPLPVDRPPSTVVRFRAPMDRQPPRTPGALQLSAPPPNAILLPVAYSRTGSPRVHALGHPQVVIPVAVPRGAPFPVGSLILEQQWTTGIDVPLGRLPVGCHQQTTSFCLPLTLRPTPAEQTLARSPTVPAVASPVVVKPGSTPLNVESSEQQKPLDLSVKAAPVRPRSAPMRTPPPVHAKVVSGDRPYVCECGIAFSSVHTLRGHQQFYCRALSQSGSDASAEHEEHSSPASSSARKQTQFKCQYCDYVGLNSSQLSQHLRSVHSAIQGFLCQLCGYKGYSVRGMKSHMRSHTQLNARQQNLEELILSYVTTLTAIASPAENGDHDPQDPPTQESEPLPPAGIVCQQCQAVFDEMEAYEQHSCVKVGSIDLEKHKSQENGAESVDLECRIRFAPDGAGRAFACQRCNYRSPYKGNMKRHLQLIHKMDD